MKIIRKHKYITYCLLVLFYWSASGVNLDVHFCAGNFAGVKLISLSGSDSCCATTCEMDSGDDDCCEDKEVHASLDYDGQVISYDTDHNKEYYLERGLVFSGENIQLFKSQFLIPADTGPPLKGTQIRVLYQSFLC